MAYHVAILSTHPIQYQSPWFRALARSREIEAEVFFCHKATPQEQADAGFGVAFDWDTPLLDGYRYRFLRNVAKVPSIASFGGLNTPEIKDIIARERFDAVVIHGWNYKSAWQAIHACWQNKTPVMVRGDSHLLTRRHPFKKALKLCVYSAFIPKFDACLAVGKLSRDYYLHYGAHTDRVFTVPHVIDEDFFDAEALRWAKHESEQRQQWQLKDDAIVFLFAAKFVEKKRPFDFIKAIELAASMGAPVMGLMVGDGPLRCECEDYVRANNIPVQFTGFLNQSEITKAYVASDALVMTSDGETWGLVVNEAMFLGKPCVLSDAVGCVPDMISPGLTGQTFPAGDIDTLGRVLSELAHDRMALNTMGKQAKGRAREFSIKAAVEGLVKAVEAVSQAVK